MGNSSSKKQLLKNIQKGHDLNETEYEKFLKENEHFQKMLQIKSKINAELNALDGLVNIELKYKKNNKIKNMLRQYKKTIRNVKKEFQKINKNKEFNKKLEEYKTIKNNVLSKIGEYNADMSKK